MKAEKFVLSFIAILFGLFVAGIGFYIYQSTKVVPKEAIKPLVKLSPTPTPTAVPAGIPLTITQPLDESVSTTKTITIQGKTDADITVVISTPTNDEVVNPTPNGDFSSTVTLDNGENRIAVTGMGPNGVETTKIITVTYSTESF